MKATFRFPGITQYPKPSLWGLVCESCFYSFPHDPNHQLIGKPLVDLSQSNNFIGEETSTEMKVSHPKSQIQEVEEEE